MDRRAFIGSLVGGVATATAVRTWPFRVYSFPTEIFSMEKLRRIYVDRALAEIDRAIRDYYPLPHVLCLPSFRLQDSDRLYSLAQSNAPLDGRVWQLTPESINKLSQVTGMPPVGPVGGLSWPNLDWLCALVPENATLRAPRASMPTA